jgi:hypothetical protein
MLAFEDYGIWLTHCWIKVDNYRATMKSKIRYKQMRMVYVLFVSYYENILF